MSRRPDPQRIYEAKREGLRGRIVSSWKLAPDDADRQLEAWDDEARVRGLDRHDAPYWSEGEAWIRGG